MNGENVSLLKALLVRASVLLEADADLMGGAMPILAESRRQLAGEILSVLDLAPVPR
jgi:hypothetical protein